ncbi:MAG: hypothetical protein H6712_22255 [Myxococcales bacterium]|nr:hypothetical protein [Myxococcales bacterium]MCB9716598.1 hypothetical protein [Myxococcales bacterium]
MSAAIDRTRWARRPQPRSLDELVAFARSGERQLRARIRLPQGWAEVYLAGSRVLHAKLGWAVGRRALRRIAEAGCFAELRIELHGGPELVTIDEPWAALRLSLPVVSRRPALHATTPRPCSRVRGVG